MQERIKEHKRNTWFACAKTSAISEHASKTGHHLLWNEVKFIDRDSHWYTWRVKEAIHIRLHPNNINRDNGIEIPEAWMPMIKKHNRTLVCQQTAEGTTLNQTSQEITTQWNSGDPNPPITGDHWYIWRLALSSQNVTTYNSSNYMWDKQYYTFYYFYLLPWWPITTSPRIRFV